MKKLELIGMKTWVNSVSIQMYFSNGEVKNCYEEDLGFKVNNDLRETIVSISGYKDKQVWDSEKQTHTIVGEDEKQIVSCVIEANQNTIDEYMYNIGIFNESIDVNRTLIEDKLQSNFESTVSHLASSISFLENTIGEMNRNKQTENV
jgi:bacterioferritin (cytochrome b1)